MKSFVSLFRVRIFLGMIFLCTIPLVTNNKIYSNALKAEENEISAIEADPLGPRVAICLTEGVYIYDAAVDETEQISSLNCAAITWATESALIAVDDKTGTIANVLSAVPDVTQLQKYPEAPNAYLYFQWSQDKRYLVNSEHGIMFWQVDNGVLVHELNEVPHHLFSLSPDGSLIAVTRDPAMGIDIWEVSTETLRSVLAEDMYIGRIRWSPNGQYLALEQIYTSTSTPNLMIWDVKKNMVYKSLSYVFDKDEYIYGNITAIAWNRDSDEIATAIYLGGNRNFSTSVSNWNIHSGTKTEDFLNIPGTVSLLSWGDVLAGYDNLNDELYIWEMDSFSQPTIIPLDNLDDR